MNINNNYNNYNSSFSGIDKDKIPMLSNDEKTNLLIEKSRDILYQRAEREVPENGKFIRVFVAFDIPETQNEALMIVEPDAIDPKINRRFSIGVHRQNSDRLTSNYIFKGSKKEILDYLKNNDNQSELYKIVTDLSKSVDDYYSSL